MGLEKRSVYLIPQKLSDIIPMIGEALLLYDTVTLDVSLPGSFDVLAKKICIDDMQYLIEKKILQLVYPNTFPVIAKQTNKTLNSILLMDFNKNGILPIDNVKIRATLKPIYPEALIDNIFKSVNPIKLSSQMILENCYMDLNNTMYVGDIFGFVKEYFDLPDFTVDIHGEGCLFEPKTKDKMLANRVYDEATYGLYLIAEVNYRMALLGFYDEIVCEKEFERFFTKKLTHAFMNYDYKQQSENLMELCVINDFPDLKELISSGFFEISDILKLRNGDGQVLRSWLRSVTKTCVSESTSFSRECAKMLTKANKGIPIPARTVVFGLLQGLSIVKPVESTLLSAANEFLVPKLVNDWQPRWFFDKAKKLYLSKKQLSS
jgi:hypothetical protein